MVLRWVLGLVGLYHLVNGVWMIADPMGWYAAVPGVVNTGPMNHHFIIDIGLAYAASGAGMLLGTRAGKTAAVLGLAGAVWPSLHALFHVYGWIAVQAPPTLHLWLSEGLGVVVAALLALVLAWMRAREEGVV